MLANDGSLCENRLKNRVGESESECKRKRFGFVKDMKKRDMKKRESSGMVRGRVLPDVDSPARAAKHGSIVSQMSRKPGAFGVRFKRQM